jgi:haloalkane dehalogenase
MTFTFTPQLLGEAENALRAVLGRVLAGTGVTYQQWVLLNVTAADGKAADRDRLTARATDALKISPAALDAEIAALTAAGYLDADRERVRLTPAGRQWHADRRAAVGQATGRIFSNLPEDDLAAATRVLTAVTTRANDLLATHRVPVLNSYLSYRDTGLGRPVVFLHGNPTWSYLWRNVLPHVAGQVRAVAPDLVGMGESGKPDIAYRFADHVRYLDAWFDALDLHDVVLVGHDWGGALALDWARRHPTRVRGVALMETFLRPLTWDDYTGPAKGFFEGLRTPRVGEKMIYEDNFFITTALPATTRSLSPADTAAYAAPFADPASRTPMLQWPREIPIEGSPADVHDLMLAYGQWLADTPQIPKLLLTAEPGSLVTPQIEQWARDTVAALEVEGIGPAGHHAPEDQPDAIGQAIARWLVRHELT